MNEVLNLFSPYLKNPFQYYISTADWFWVMKDKAKNEIAKAAALLDRQTL